MLHSVELEKHMLKNPVTVLPEANLLEAVQKILQYKVSGICVVDVNHYLVGMLSEMDCLRGILGATYNQSGVGSVAEYMTRDVDIVYHQDDIVDVANDMLLKKQRRRPVVDDDGKLMGLISCRQLLDAVKEFSNTETRHS